MKRLRDLAQPVDTQMDDTKAEVAERRWPSRPSLLAVTFLLAVGVGLPVLLGAISGSLFIPRNDDPAYRRVALDLFSTGRLQLNGWNSMTLVGQIIFVQPFLWLSGGASWAFTASTAVLAATGIVAGYSLARRVLSVPRAMLAVLGVLLFPGFLLNTTSYMTDVPAWSAGVACLSLGAVALDRRGYRRWLWLCASLAAGCFGFSIREFAIMAPAAVLLTLALAPSGGRRAFLIAAPATAVLCGAIYLFATHLPGPHGTFDVGLSNLSSLSVVGVRLGFSTLALMLSPVLVVAIALRWRRWRAIDVLVGVAAWLAFFRGPLVDALRTGEWPQAVVGNLITVGGSLGSEALYGPRPELFAGPSWLILNAAALIAGLVVCGVGGGALGAYLRGTVRGLREGRGLGAIWGGWTGSTWPFLGVFVVLYGAGMCAWSLVFHLSTFDRYLWPLLLPLYAFLLRPVAEVPEALAAVSTPPVPVAPSRPPRRIRQGAAVGFGAVILAVITATSLVLLVNADAFDAARWRMGDAAVERGSAAGTVDAGFEWVVFHAMGSGKNHKPVPALGGMYDQWWPSFHMCALVSAEPLTDAGLRLEAQDDQAYRLFLFAGPWEPLYLYSVQNPGCP